MPDSRELLSAYREMLGGLRRSVGPAGALFAPLEMTADLLDQLVVRQQEMETQLNTAVHSLRDMYEWARGTPAVLRTQAQAFEAASASFSQAAKVMNVQADLLERTIAALDIPAGLVRSARPSSERAPSRSKRNRPK